jgi:hypothetical protein
MVVRATVRKAVIAIVAAARQNKAGCVVNEYYILQRGRMLINNEVEEDV